MFDGIKESIFIIVQTNLGDQKIANAILKFCCPPIFDVNSADINPFDCERRMKVTYLADNQRVCQHTFTFGLLTLDTYPQLCELKFNLYEWSDVNVEASCTFLSNIFLKVLLHQTRI